MEGYERFAVFSSLEPWWRKPAESSKGSIFICFIRTQNTSGAGVYMVVVGGGEVLWWDYWILCMRIQRQPSDHEAGVDV